ncbi:methionyl-tRNA formyltransferase [Candidatus Kaiserbacteria bacterium]|nr:methionyl-tRNA formyltransferase [Candidatus Kaiserbacteria bacterium]
MAMKILLFSGNHPRHAFIHSAVLKAFEVCGIVHMQRENIIPEPPAGTMSHDAENFRRHFADRYAAEQKYFGEMKIEDIATKVPIHQCNASNLNSQETADFVQKCAPDIVFIFGTKIIKDPVLSVLPKDRVNMHVGLSPWYKGAATLFWPFYNMQPQFCGVTFHQIVPAADAGAVIHQCVPELSMGDGIHDVACKTLIAAQKDLSALLKQWGKNGSFFEVQQRTSGRLYLESAFRPEHLRVIYDLFSNDMVDAYLRGELSQNKPTLITGI